MSLVKLLRLGYKIIPFLMYMWIIVSSILWLSKPEGKWDFFGIPEDLNIYMVLIPAIIMGFVGLIRSVNRAIDIEPVVEEEERR